MRTQYTMSSASGLHAGVGVAAGSWKDNRKKGTTESEAQCSNVRCKQVQGDHSFIHSELAVFSAPACMVEELPYLLYPNAVKCPLASKSLHLRNRSASTVRLHSTGVQVTR